jgi:hypothetical protein
MRSAQVTLRRLVGWQDLKSLKSQAAVWQLDTQPLNSPHRCQTTHPPLDRRHPTGPQVKLSPIGARRPDQDIRINHGTLEDIKKSDQLYCRHGDKA